MAGLAASALYRRALKATSPTRFVPKVGVWTNGRCWGYFSASSSSTSVSTELLSASERPRFWTMLP